LLVLEEWARQYLDRAPEVAEAGVHSAEALA
jgi:hypothetical protein